MAEQAVHVVLSLGQDRAPAFSRVEMATTLVVRDSTDVVPRRSREMFRD
jgi:hypothetical protein